MEMVLEKHNHLSEFLLQKFQLCLQGVCYENIIPLESLAVTLAHKWPCRETCWPSTKTGIYELDILRAIQKLAITHLSLSDRATPLFCNLCLAIVFLLQLCKYNFATRILLKHFFHPQMCMFINVSPKAMGFPVGSQIPGTY